jgi:hypothetical protein
MCNAVYSHPKIALALELSDMLRSLEHKPCGIQESRSPGGDCYTFQGAGFSIFF